VDSTGSGYGLALGCCECGDEPSGSGATELVVFHREDIQNSTLNGVCWCCSHLKGLNSAQCSHLKGLNSAQCSGYTQIS
jgi:hypothetical protein